MVVDFGAAPLSMGHVDPQNASPGTQIVVRGSGFDSGTAATVGGVAASVPFTDEKHLDAHHSGSGFRVARHGSYRKRRGNLHAGKCGDTPTADSFFAEVN
jgi:hypothetical protein